MKKVAIITLNHGINYGNKLQNYAVQTIFERLGYEAITIRFFPEGAKVENNSRISVNSIWKKICQRISNIKFSARINSRSEAFEHFNEECLHRTKKCYTPTDYMTIDENGFEYFSVGSDQVWNSYFFDFTPMYLLDFVKDNRKKIAYAASVGVKDIAPEYRKLFADKLKQFKAISVREEDAAQLIGEIIEKKVDVVLDPTLMLSQTDWENFCAVSRFKPKKYILTYFLGKVTKERKKIIYDYSRAINAKIVELNNLQNEYYDCDPREFVSLFRTAEMIFTDSFHACCFSLMFKKPFWVMNRVSKGKEMGSRIDNLLSKFHLESRKYSEATQLTFPIDYSYAEKILDEERKKSLQFLQIALEDTIK